MAIGPGDVKFYKAQYMNEGGIIGGDIGDGSGNSGWANAVVLSGIVGEIFAQHNIDGTNRTYYKKIFIANSNTTDAAQDVRFFIPNLLNCWGTEDATNITTPGDLVGDKYIKIVFGNTADDASGYKIRISGVASGGGSPLQEEIVLNGTGPYYSTNAFSYLDTVVYIDTSTGNAVAPSNGNISIYKADDTLDTNLTYMGNILMNISGYAVGNIAAGYNLSSSKDTTTTNEQTAPETGGTTPNTINFHYTSGHITTNEYNGGQLVFTTLDAQGSTNDRYGIWLMQFVHGYADPEANITFVLRATYV